MRHDEVWLHINPSDNESLHWARKLGGTLPAQALAARHLAGSRKVKIVHFPLADNCTEESPATFFVRPHHAANMCHLYNEALLPMAYLMHGVRPPRELYYYSDNMIFERPLVHWDVVTSHLAVKVAPAQTFFRRRVRVAVLPSILCKRHAHADVGSAYNTPSLCNLHRSK